MAETEKKVLIKVDGDTKNADKAIRSLDDTVKGFGKVLKTVGTAAAGLTAAVAGAAIAFDQIAGRSGKVQQTRADFDSLSNSIGETSETMLGALNRATRGTVSNFDSMLLGSKLMSMGLAGSAEQMEQVVKTAVRLGDKTQDATSNVENFALMLANQSIPRLDSFGIPSGKVRSRIEELMAANAGMTRETAFMTATLEEAEKSMSVLGDVQETAAEKVDRLKARFKNLIDDALVELSPLLLEIANEVIPKIETAITNFAETMPDKIQAVTDAWHAFKLGVTEGEDALIESTETFGNTEQALRDLDGEIITTTMLWENLGYLWGIVKDAFATMIILIWDAGIKTFNFLARTIGTVIEGFKLMGENLSTLGQDFKANLELVKENFSNWKSVVIQNINEVIMAINKIPGVNMDLIEDVYSGRQSTGGSSRVWGGVTPNVRDYGQFNNQTASNEITINYTAQGGTDPYEVASNLSFLMG